MKAPRCKICGTEHRLGPCPDTMADKFVDAMFPKTKPRPAFRNPFEDAARGRDTTGAKSKPRFNIAEQVRILGADSLLPPKTFFDSVVGEKKRMAKAKAKKRVKKVKRSKPVRPKPRKPMPPGGLHPRVGRPLAENVDSTLAAVQPWLDLKPPVSRSTWFRRVKREKTEVRK